MNWKRRMTMMLAVAMLAGLATRAGAEILGLAPKDYEVVIGVNVRQIADSPIFAKFMELRPNTRWQLDEIDRRLGVNPVRDVDRAFVFGKIDNEDSFCLVLKGRIDPRRVLTTLATFSDNTTQTLFGLTVHGWRDPRDGRFKRCAFLPDGTAIFWNSQAAMEAGINAIRDESQSLLESPDGELIPDEQSPLAFWMITIGRNQPGPAPTPAPGQATPTPTPTPQPTQVAQGPQGAQAGQTRPGARRKGLRRRGPRNFKYDRMKVTVMLTGKDVEAHLTMNMPSAEDAQRWAGGIKMAIAYGQMQTNNTLFHELAMRAQVSLTDEDKTGELSAKLDLQNTLDMITGKKNLDDEQN